MYLAHVGDKYTQPDGYPDFISGITDSIWTFAVLFFGFMIILALILFALRKILTRRDSADDNSLHLP